MWINDRNTSVNGSTAVKEMPFKVPAQSSMFFFIANFIEKQLFYNYNIIITGYSTVTHTK